MPTQSSVVVPPNSTGAPIDVWITTGGNRRQGIVISDPTTDANLVTIPSTGKLPVQSEVQLDYDSGAGTQNLSIVGIALPASGGAVAGGTATNPLVVNVNNASIAVTGTFWQATQPISGSVSIIGSVAVTGTFWQATQPVSIAATVNIADIDAGTSNFHLISVGSTNANNVKASAGKLFGIHVYNNAAYPIYVKTYNTAGSPTVGTSTVVNTVGVQAGTERDVTFPKGMNFATGIAMAITKGIADADATAVLASDCAVDIDYK